MKLITSHTSGRRRLMVFAPEINPYSFLFFFEKGQTGCSYSVRDYSTRHHVTERYARDFGCSADEFRRKVVRVYDAPYMDTHLLTEWCNYTEALNKECGIGAASDSIPIPAPHQSRSVDPLVGGREFPMLNS